MPKTFQQVAEEMRREQELTQAAQPQLAESSFLPETDSAAAPLNLGSSPKTFEQVAREMDLERGQRRKIRELNLQRLDAMQQKREQTKRALKNIPDIKQIILESAKPAIPFSGAIEAAKQAALPTRELTGSNVLAGLAGLGGALGTAFNPIGVMGGFVPRAAQAAGEAAGGQPELAKQTLLSEREVLPDLPESKSPSTVVQLLDAAITAARRDPVNVVLMGLGGAGLARSARGRFAQRAAERKAALERYEKSLEQSILKAQEREKYRQALNELSESEKRLQDKEQSVSATEPARALVEPAPVFEAARAAQKEVHVPETTVEPVRPTVPPIIGQKQITQAESVTPSTLVGALPEDLSVAGARSVPPIIEAIEKISEGGPRIMRNPGRVLGRGPLAEEFRSEIAKVEATAKHLAGPAMTKFEQANKNLRPADRKWLKQHMVDAIESGLEPINPRVAKFIDTWRDVANRNAAIAEAYRSPGGDPLMVTGPSGEKMPFRRIQNYYPRVLSSEATRALRLGHGPAFEALRRELHLLGFTPEMIGRIARSDMRAHQVGSLEFARVLQDMKKTIQYKDQRGVIRELRVFETDPFKILPDHIDAFANRMAVIQQYGQDPIPQRIMEWREKIAGEMASRGQSPADIVALDTIWKNLIGERGTVYDIFQGKYSPETAQAISSISRASLLSLSAIPNLVGGFGVMIGNVPMRVFLSSMARKFLSPRERRLTHELGGKHGVLRQEIFPLFELTQDMGGAFERASHGYLKALGLAAVNRFQNANSVRLAIDMLRMGEEGKLTPREMAAVNDFVHFSRDQARKWREGKLTELDKTQFMDRFVRNFNNMDISALDQSELLRSSWIARQVFAYTSWVRLVGRNVSEALDAAVLRGDYRKLSQLTAAVIGGNLLEEKIRSFLKQKASTDSQFVVHLTKELLEAGLLGIMGTMLGETIHQVQLGRGLIQAFAPPQFRILEETARMVYETSRGRLDKALLAARRANPLLHVILGGEPQRQKEKREAAKRTEQERKRQRAKMRLGLYE